MKKGWQGKDRIGLNSNARSVIDGHYIRVSHTRYEHSPLRIQLRLQIFHLSSVLETSKIAVSSTKDCHSNVITNSYGSLFALLRNQIADNRIVYILQVQTVCSL
jgi:hypothetical protein